MKTTNQYITKFIGRIFQPLLLCFFTQSLHAFYNPVQGRWCSRDPIEERGGVNLYGFVENDAVGKNDYLGMAIEKYIIGSAREDPNTALFEFNFPKAALGAFIYKHSFSNVYEKTKCDKCKLSVGGKFADPIIQFRNGDRNTMGADGLTVIDHERRHEKIAGEAFNKTADLMNQFDGAVFESEKCCLEWEKFVLTIFGHFIYTMNLQQELFDRTQYGGGDVESALLNLQYARESNPLIIPSCSAVSAPNLPK